MSPPGTCGVSLFSDIFLYHDLRRLMEKVRNSNNEHFHLSLPLILGHISYSRDTKSKQITAPTLQLKLPFSHHTRYTPTQDKHNTTRRQKTQV